MRVNERGLSEIPMSKMVAKSPFLSGITLEITSPSTIISKVCPAKPFPAIVADPASSTLNKSNLGGRMLDDSFFISEVLFVTVSSDFSEEVASLLSIDSFITFWV